jgi:peptide deformylase
VKYLDVDGNENIIEATGILARVLCHEIDHLDGILYTDLAIETYGDDEYYEEDRKDTEE